MWAKNEDTPLQSRISLGFLGRIKRTIGFWITHNNNTVFNLINNKGVWFMEKVEFHGLQNCYRISNDNIDLVATTEVGPNVVRFGFVGERNELFGKTPRGFGGHVLQHAPEAKDRKFPAMDPVAVEEHNKFIRLTQPTEIPTGIQKEMDIPTSIEGNHLSIVHRLYNRGLWPVELAPWASTLMPAGGSAILPLPPRFPPRGVGPLLPTSSIAIWCYCDLSDPRLVLGKKYVMLKQDSKVPGAYKIGMLVSDGWIAYYNDGHLFVITYAYKESALYPDLNSPVECFSAETAFELETLAPLVTLKPGASAEHVENWYLFRDVPEPQNDDNIDKNILPLIQKIKQSG